ncbi:MAG: choice-of-anchor N protein [Gammaproteobacteria bacterium]|nr:choice-of-anchor N protein [Gammaproteobacteria bacterium]
MKGLLKICAVSVALLYGSWASAVPTLQLDIAGGHYVDGSEESTITGSNTFDLYAYAAYEQTSGLVSSDSILADTYYLSVALMPKTAVAGSYGIININGVDYDVTGDMVFGTPPMTSADALLGPHGIYDTYYLELVFNFNSSNKSGVYDVQGAAGSGPIAGTGMYYNKFNFDISGLDAAHELHFDLYNTKVKQCNAHQTHCDPVITLDDFAPPSHDAGTQRDHNVPEPQTVALLGISLLMLAFVGRRRQTRQWLKYR